MYLLRDEVVLFVFSCDVFIFVPRTAKYYSTASVTQTIRSTLVPVGLRRSVYALLATSILRIYVLVGPIGFFYEPKKLVQHQGTVLLASTSTCTDALPVDNTPYLYKKRCSRSGCSGSKPTTNTTTGLTPMNKKINP
jgi:hypothetical protein